MKIIKLTKEEFSRVNDFLRDTFSSPTHWPEWNLLVSRHFATDFFYYGLEDAGILTAIFPVHQTTMGRQKELHSGQYHFIPYGGWIKSPGKDTLNIKLPVPIGGRTECFALPSLNEFQTATVKLSRKFQTMVVDLRFDENEIWEKSISSKRRNMIRKAVKTGIRIDRGIKVLDDFIRLCSEHSGLNEPANLPGSFLAEMASFSGEIKFIPMVAYSEGRSSSALGLVYDKDYAIYWLGATDRQTTGSGQGELLQWEAIRMAKNNGCSYYDLCFTDKERLPQIYEFKKGFSNSVVDVPYLNLKSIIYRVYNKIKA